MLNEILRDRMSFLTLDEIAEVVDLLKPGLLRLFPEWEGLNFAVVVEMFYEQSRVMPIMPQRVQKKDLRN